MDQLRRKMLFGVIGTVLLVFITIILFSPIFLHHFGIKQTTPTILFYSRIGMWFLLLLIWLYARRVENQDMLLWKEKEYPWWVYPVSLISILIAIVIGLLIMSVALLILKVPRDTSALQKIVELLKPHKWLLVFTALTAGVTEEITFRGYIQPRLELLFKNPQLAILVTSVLFGVMHFGFGNAYQLVGPMVIGVIFSIYYWKFRNIKVLIVAHFTWDMISLLFSTMK